MMAMEIIRSVSLDSKKAAGLVVAGALGVTYLLDYLDERKRPTPIWKYQSRPPHPLGWDRLVRVASNPLMKLVAGGIISHHWDWMKVPMRDQYQGIWLPESQNPQVQNLEKGNLTLLHHVLAHTFIWQQAYILGLDQSKIGDEWPKIEGFHYGWQLAEFDHVVKSRIFIPKEEQIMVLIGAKSPRVIALDSENNEFPLQVVGPKDRSDPEIKQLRQL
jgi:hypothetical protein